MNQIESKSPSTFVRILLVTFSVLLAAMIGYNFIVVTPVGDINAGIITLLSFLLVLVLSESFDNFSVGQLVTVTRKAQKQAKEVEKLGTRNAELLSQLISISTANTQNQNHTNVYGDYHQAATVTKASEEEVEESATTESSGDSANEGSRQVRVRYDWRAAERLCLDKYLSGKDIHTSNVITEAKLTTQFHGIDPVSSHQPIYDAYYRDGEEEVFVEFRPNRRSTSFMLRDRLYVMVSKIAHYRRTKNVEAHLDLVLMTLPDEEKSNGLTIPAILESFEPAVASGLLRVSELKLSDEEMAQISVGR
jgi:hypothetical protein